MDETPSMAERMQQLLSRAVEDQVSEQRALQQVLAEVRAALGRVESGSSGQAREAVEQAVAGAVERLETEVRGSTATLDGRLYDVLVRLYDVQQVLAGVPTGIAAAADLLEVRDGVAGVRTDLDTLPDRLAQTVSGVVTRAVSVGLGDVRGPVQALAALPERLDEVHAEVGSLGGRFDAVSGLSGELADLRAQLTGMAERLEALDTVDGAALSSELSSGFGTLGSDLAALVTRLTGMDARVARSAAAQEPLRLGLAEVERRLGSLDESLDTLRAEVSRESVAAPLTEELGALRSDLEGLRRFVHDELTSSIPGTADISEAVRAAMRGAMRDLVGESLRDSVRAAVAAATAESERRLEAHVDEAVLALAEALLRPRAAAGPAEAAPGSEVAAAAEGPGPVPVPAEVVAELTREEEPTTPTSQTATLDATGPAGEAEAARAAGAAGATVPAAIRLPDNDSERLADAPAAHGPDPAPAVDSDLDLVPPAGQDLLADGRDDDAVAAGRRRTWWRAGG